MKTTGATASERVTPVSPGFIRCSVTPRCPTPSTPQRSNECSPSARKRYDRTLVTFLTTAETDALLAAPNPTTWTGRRDRALFTLAVQTGLRISELTGINNSDIHLATGAHVRCRGKGRKELTASTVTTITEWLHERGGQSDDPVFPARNGGRLSRDAIEHRLKIHTATAADHCPTLATKNVTCHVLRHTAAMRLLEAGVDTTVIALWLGHFSEERNLSRGVSVRTVVRFCVTPFAYCATRARM